MTDESYKRTIVSVCWFIFFMGALAGGALAVLCIVFMQALN